MAATAVYTAACILLTVDHLVQVVIHNSKILFVIEPDLILSPGVRSHNETPGDEGVSSDFCHV